MAVPFSNTKLRVPHGFPSLLEGLSREVLRHQPKDIYGFAEKYFEELLIKREETGIDDLAQLSAKLDDRYYNNKAYCYSALSSSNPKQQEAAVVIQSEYRRHRASQEVDELRQEQAAVQIQSTYRGYRDRKSIGKFTNQSNEAEQTLEDDVPSASAPPVPFEEYSPQTEELRLVVSTLPRTSGTGHGEEGEVQQQQPDVETNLKENHSTLITSTTATSSSTTAPTTVTATTTSTEDEPQTESIDTDEEKRTQAAICIQAHYRGHLSRKKYRVTVAIEKKDTECENTEQVNESDSKPTVEITESESRSGSQDSQNHLLDELQNDKEPSEPVTQTPSETEPEDQKVSSETTKDRIYDTVVDGTESDTQDNSGKSESQNLQESKVVVVAAVESAEPTLQQSSLHDLENTSSSQETQQLSESREVTDQESDKEKEKTAGTESSTPE